MRPRRKLTWVVFAVCILAVLEGLGWVTWHALRLERAEREARAAAQFQESIRLALWRMESEVTPIIAAEAARPYFHYRSFYPAERAYTRMWQQVKPNEVQVPSPLLESSGPYIRLHFQIEPDGRITSPQAPTGNQRDLAEGQQYVDSEFIVLAGQMLEELTAIVQAPSDTERSLAYRERADPATRAEGAAIVPEAPAPSSAAPQQQQVQSEIQVGTPLDQLEFQARQKAAESAQVFNIGSNDRRSTRKQASKAEEAPEADQKLADKAFKKDSPDPAAVPPPPAGVAAAPPEKAKVTDADREAWKDAGRPAGTETGRRVLDPGEGKVSLLKEYQSAGPATEQIKIDQGPFIPMWRTNPKTSAPELLLTRTVLIEGTRTVQGLWIDWPQLMQRLTATTKELLPEGSLVPAKATENDAGGRRLAAIPVQLLPGPVPPLAATAATPTHITLAVTWAAVLGAIIAIAVVLRTAMELSERRGRFVSAVTHELRTPLTTFCLYTEMLSGGMVKDENAQRQYLGTLHRESGRLARIVQNVLDYAGIGGVGRRTPGSAPVLSVPDLVARLTPVLEQCASQAGMTLVSETEGIDQATVRVDPQTVERILLNLVENAGKYAGDAADRRVHFASRRSDGQVVLSIRDHGPGIPSSEHRRVFRAFQRGSRDAHGPKSGLGLGLALAKELAAELGGKLAYQPCHGPGAMFTLAIPVAPKQDTK